MKKWIIPIICLTAAVAWGLAACNTQTASTESPATMAGGAAQQAELPLPLKLALGTLKLEGTELAVTAEQAAELLPLWKAVNSLSQTDNISSEELDGLYDQIQETMTSEQMDMIQSLDLSPQNMGALAQELGIEFRGGFGNFTEEQRATMEAARQSGRMPDIVVSGDGPGGGPGGRSGGEFFVGPEGGPPPGAERGARGTANGNIDQASGVRRLNGFGSMFYQALIDLLQEKIQ